MWWLGFVHKKLRYDTFYFVFCVVQHVLDSFKGLLYWGVGQEYLTRQERPGSSFTLQQLLLLQPPMRMRPRKSLKEPRRVS